MNLLIRTPRRHFEHPAHAVQSVSMAACSVQLGYGKLLEPGVARFLPLTKASVMLPIQYALPTHIFISRTHQRTKKHQRTEHNVSL